MYETQSSRGVMNSGNWVLTSCISPQAGPIRKVSLVRVAHLGAEFGGHSIT
ncbi:hypothetical protein DIRU0_C15874 [Diutina rugosa]